MKLLVSVSLLVLTLLSYAADATFRYYFDMAPTSLEDFDALIDALEPQTTQTPPESPLVVVLHGDHASAFIRDNYGANRQRVDRAALLDAYGVIDIKMCATWMRLNNITENDIPPFIETVPYGATEIERLRNNGYLDATRVKL